MQFSSSEDEKQKHKVIKQNTVKLVGAITEKFKIVKESSDSERPDEIQDIDESPFNKTSHVSRADEDETPM